MKLKDRIIVVTGAGSGIDALINNAAIQVNKTVEEITLDPSIERVTILHRLTNKPVTSPSSCVVVLYPNVRSTLCLGKQVYSVEA